MLWHILTFMGVIFMSSGTPTEEHPAEDITPTEPIEFIFRDAFLPEYYEQGHKPDFDELRQRGLVWKHYDIHPNDFEYIGLYLGDWRRDPIYLYMINDNDMFLQLKELWEQEASDGLSDISANEFFSFLYAADFLRIRGDAYKRFTGNMARMGLLGTHSQEIISEYMDPQFKREETYWDLFLAFAAGLKCEVRVSGQTMTFCSTGSRYGTILETKPKTTMKELRILSDEFERYKNVGTHMAYYIVWFLWHLDLHELNLSGCEVDENDVDAFGQAFSKAGDIELQAMNIFWCRMAPGSIARILPHLKYLTKLYAAWNILNEADRDALAASTLLTELNVTSCFEDSGYLARILPHLKYLTKLDAAWNILNEADRDALAASTLLTELNVTSCFEDSGYLARILPHLKYLTKLDASYNSLDEADHDALAARTSLTELDVGYCFWNSPGSLAAILPYLNHLTKLYIRGNSLNEADRKAIEAAREHGTDVRE
jgi:hypothetical protein